MRVLLAVERFDKASGGQAIWARGFAQHLLQQGYEVHVAATRFDSDLTGIALHPVDWIWSPRGRSRAFNAVIEAVQPDVVHDSGVACWPGVLHPQTGSNLASLDQLIASEPAHRRLRAALSPKMILLRRQMRQLEMEQVRIARRIVAVSPLVAKLLAGQHPDAAAKTAIVPNGVDLDRFTPAANRPEQAGPPLRIIAAAHNPALKGVDTVLRAMRRLHDDGVAASLTVAGAVLDGKWRSLIERLELTHLVSFLGQVDDMPAFYRTADVFVHATRWDACSLATLEAMACGLPVITTARNGAADVIADGVSGFVVDEPEDDARIAVLLRQLMDNRARKAMASAARSAVSRHEISSNCDRVEKLLFATAGEQYGAHPA